MIRQPPRSTLFPSTPLFRSAGQTPPVQPGRRRLEAATTSSTVVTTIRVHRGPSARGRRVGAAAEGGDALLAHPPHVLEAASSDPLPAGDPGAAKPPAAIILV